MKNELNIPDEIKSILIRMFPGFHKRKQIEGHNKWNFGHAYFYKIVHKTTPDRNRTHPLQLRCPNSPNSHSLVLLIKQIKSTKLTMPYSMTFAVQIRWNSN